MSTSEDDLDDIDSEQLNSQMPKPDLETAHMAQMAPYPMASVPRSVTNWPELVREI